MAPRPPSARGPASPAAQMIQQAVGLHRQGRLFEAEGLYTSVLSQRPNHFDALYLLGMLRLQQGRAPEALQLIEAAARIKPYAPEALTSLGAALAALNRHAEALPKYDRLVKLNPRDVDAQYNRGVVLSHLGRQAEALKSYETALALRPDHPPALFNRANTLAQLGRLDDARMSYDKLVALVPNHVEALNNRGNVLGALGRQAEALASYDKALATKPDHVDALNNRGNVLRALGRHEEALAAYEKVFALDPRRADALNNRGNALLELERTAEALASFDRALALEPDDPEFLFNRACALEQAHRLEDALKDFDRSLALRPVAKTLHNRGNVLAFLGRNEDALESFDRALALEPDRSDTLHNRGNLFITLRRDAEAIADYERAFALDPRHPSAFDSLGFAQISVCNWPEAARLAQVAETAIRDGNVPVGPPFPLYYFGNPAYQLYGARAYLKANGPPSRPPLAPAAAGRPDKLRVAYLSSDFRFHPVAAAIVEVFERHDRDRFEIVGVSSGRDDGSEIRARIIRAFDQFHDVGKEDDRSVAELLRRLDVHVVVDLNGLTRGWRPGVLAYRPAPVQAVYLGYPGTTGADFIDYVLADATVLPLEQQPFFTETIVHLPDCYHPNDTTRLAAETPERSALGLPDDAFVFCCFNQSHKISEGPFDAWMRLLTRVESSVLWLSSMNAAASENLRAAVAARGVDPARVIFAPRLERIEDHLARHRRADLFLDTLPYNAHSTAIDALWAGLPVVTSTGAAFAGRVGTTLLKAAGLPELVTKNLDEYEALAAKLAADPALLKAFRDKLATNRTSAPLFDTVRLARRLEAAYATMWEIAARGERPRHFAVPE